MANAKLLLPTYRTRHRFVADALAALSRTAPVDVALHLGTGEGDYDPLIAAHVGRLMACDISLGDIRYARELAGQRAAYTVADAQRLAFGDETFSLVVTVDVIEHVPDSRAMVREIARVVRRGGRVLLTCPSRSFPLSYDPVNAALQRIGTHVPVGAYAYGHFKLMDEDTLEGWFAEEGLAIEQKTRLSGPLTGLVEAYWPGLVQRLVKANAGNQQGEGEGRFTVRPTWDEPRLLPVVDRFIDMDAALARRTQRSIGLGYLLCRA
jgi:ubiquinone/menaquinone biosynthesis C-methylase UbiE